jgi:hypothetical protein
MVGNDPRWRGEAKKVAVVDGWGQAPEETVKKLSPISDISIGHWFKHSTSGPFSTLARIWFDLEENIEWRVEKGM